MNGVDDLAVIDSLQIDRGNPEIRVAELPLDHVERHAFSSHLNSVRVPKLMRREATTHAGSDRELAGGFANSRGRPWATLRRTVDDAKQCSDAQGDAEAQPRVDLFPRPPIHAYLASLAAFASADEDRAALSVEVTLR
jgi:hypothetical protein